MITLINISKKLEDFRRQFETTRTIFRTLVNEMKPVLYQFSNIENKISENNRIIDSFLTSISNTSKNIEKNNTLVYKYEK